jgi:hypothetical protein
MLGLSEKSSRIGCGAAVVVVLSAAAAQAGVTISAKPTKNMSCSNGTCSANAKNAVLNISDLAGMLAAGDVIVASGSAAQDIQIDAALTWTSNSRLTLDSYHAIAFDKPVVVAGTGALTITVNDGGTGGDFTFSGKGHVEFWDTTSSLVIGGTPYELIRRTDQLQKFVGKNPSGFFALARDYNAQKDGTVKRGFISDLTGAIEGLGNKISNFTMAARVPEVALCSENHGTVRDLTLANVSVTGRDGLIAGLVGHNYGTVRNSVVSGQVLSTGPGGSMGGLVAYNEGTISGSHSSATVNGSGGYQTGGLVGSNELQGTISTSFATGAVIGGDGEFGGGATGGLVGDNEATVSQSYATGSVSGTGSSEQSGGLIGSNGGDASNVYATGAVDGLMSGGLVGDSNGNPIAISKAYSTGAVNGSLKQGGFAGQDDGEVIATSYWDLDSSGINDPSQGAGSPQDDPGITGLTDAQLKSGLPSGFDPAIWAQSPSINNGYPYLLALPPG